MNQAVIESVMQRMEKLERENRRLKTIGGLGLAVLALLALVGAGVTGQRSIEAESFIVKDQAGKVRAVLGTAEPYNAPGLVMYDQEGHPNILLHLTGDGDPGLWLYEKDSVRATLNAVGERVQLQLHDNESRQRAVVSILKDGNPSIELYDQDENVRSSLK